MNMKKKCIYTFSPPQVSKRANELSERTEIVFMCMLEEGKQSKQQKTLYFFSIFFFLSLIYISKQKQANLNRVRNGNGAKLSYIAIGIKLSFHHHNCTEAVTLAQMQNGKKNVGKFKFFIRTKRGKNKKNKKNVMKISFVNGNFFPFLLKIKIKVLNNFLHPNSLHSKHGAYTYIIIFMLRKDCNYYSTFEQERKNSINPQLE